jgi:phosphatidylglycerophosphatase C
MGRPRAHRHAILVRLRQNAIMSTQPPSAIALFDLDGTLTYGDTLLQFLTGYLALRPWRLLRTPSMVPALIVFAFGGRDRGCLKSRAIRAVLGGVSRAEVQAFAERFVAALEPRGRFRPGGLATLEAHRAAGDRLILLSASPDLYVPLIGRLLGFERSICTEVRWSDGHLDGALATENRRGEEKVRCLERLRAEFPGAAVTAYGNSGSDLPHLARADRGVLVNAAAAARKQAAVSGIATDDWP